jgi:hypothetical protein
VRQARIKWGIPGGNAAAERARPRSGRGAAERGDRLCRKPGARHSWDEELRYTLNKIGRRRSGGQRGGAMDLSAVGRRRPNRLKPGSVPARHAAQCRAKQPARSAAIAATGGRDAPAADVSGTDRPKGGFLPTETYRWAVPIWRIDAAGASRLVGVRRGLPARSARTAGLVRPGSDPRSRARIRAQRSYPEIVSSASCLTYERGGILFPPPKR